MSLLLFFVDGIGVGRAVPDVNPFARRSIAHLGVLAGRRELDGASVRALDATLGVPGLPQSATGQTTLFTGVNAARVLGRHAVGIPGPSLWPLLERRSMFRQLVAADRRPIFVNSYTRTHLEATRPRHSATTRMVRASGVPFRMIDDPNNRSKLTHDYTGTWARRRGIDVPRRDAEDAASRLLDELEDHDLVLYEVFLTDLAGHRGTWRERIEQAERVEALVAALVERLDRRRHGVVLVSDHGNLEESDHDRHTRNPVPLVGWGGVGGEVVRRVRRMTDLTPAIVEVTKTP